MLLRIHLFIYYCYFFNFIIIFVWSRTVFVAAALLFVAVTVDFFYAVAPIGAGSVIIIIKFLYPQK